MRAERGPGKPQAAARPRARWSAHWAKTFGWAWLSILLLAAAGSPSKPASRDWSVVVIRTTSRADTVVPRAPRLQGRIVEAPLIEGEPETLRGSSLIEVEVLNRSRVQRTLRWDVSRSPYLVLPHGRSLYPIGHKLSGLAKNSLAITGTLEVDVPPLKRYRLYPVYALARIPGGSSLVIDSVGLARVPSSPERH